MTRRTLLLASTAVAGSGVLLAGWPIIRQMSPDASARAHRTALVTLTDIALDSPKIVNWQRMPVYVLRRSPSAVLALRDTRLALRDPLSTKRQQPSYAANWHRSIAPEIGVFVGICTHCRCKIQAGDPVGPAAAFVCPCCASRFDWAGRAYEGPAQYNLPVPPYAILSGNRIVIGANPPGQSFGLKELEQL